MLPIDYAIICVYLLGLVIAGAWVARRAGRSSEDYFLAGKTTPWWALGASGMASNLDVAGTMTIVAVIYLFGLHGFFLEFRGGVVLPIAVFLAFMGKWHRRSAVMTTAEWMLLRFGAGWQGRIARSTAVVTYVVLTIAMTAFFFTAGGKFLAEFLPFTANQCSAGMALVAFSYTLAGGLYGVIWTDVFQAAIIGAASVYVSVLAAGQLSPEVAALWPGAEFNQFVPRWSDERFGEYSSFGWFLLLWAGKGVLEGLGGSPGSAYMAQRYYAARTDAECQKLAMLWTVLFAFRWPMVLGFAILAVKLGLDPSAPENAERVLPVVLQSDYFPAGVRGLVIAALLAAAMSTFDSTVNAGASYLVRDVYEPLRPGASTRETVWAGYVSSAAIVGAGLFISSLSGASVLETWVQIVMLLFPAFLVPFALRWFWGRLNGAGFSAGVAAGFLAATAMHLAAPPAWNEAQRFLFVAACSLVVCLLATVVTPPVPSETLFRFHAQVGPFGWWPKAWLEPFRAEHRADGFRLLIALAWQVLTFLIPMGLVLGRMTESALLSIAWLAMGWYLARELRPGAPATRAFRQPPA